MEDIKLKVLNKMNKEQDKYRDYLCSLTAKEALEYACSYIVREDIIIAFEDVMEYMAEDMLTALYSLSDIMSAIYDKYCDIETGHMHDVRTAIFETIDNELEKI